MIQQSSIVFLIIGILLTNLGSLSLAEESTNSTRSISLPADLFSFQSGKGQEIANTYCLICHSADYIYMQPAHSEKKWQAIITNMQRIFGCPIPQDQIPTLSTYLFHQNFISTLPPTGSR